MQIVNQYSGVLMIIFSAALLFSSLIGAKKKSSRRWPLPAAAFVLFAAVAYFVIHNRTGAEHISPQELEQLLSQPNETPVLLELYSEY